MQLCPIMFLGHYVLGHPKQNYILLYPWTSVDQEGCNFDRDDTIDVQGASVLTSFTFSPPYLCSAKF